MSEKVVESKKERKSGRGIRKGRRRDLITHSIHHSLNNPLNSSPTLFVNPNPHLIIYSLNYPPVPCKVSTKCNPHSTKKLIRKSIHKSFSSPLVTLYVLDPSTLLYTLLRTYHLNCSARFVYRQFSVSSLDQQLISFP